MLKLISIITIAYITLFTSSVKADLTDCIDRLTPLGVSRDRAEEACSKACRSDKNSDSKRELYRLCRAAQKGNGNTLRYSNGQVMTSWAGRKGATWYYPNGRVMTSWAGNKNTTWYYSNGQVITSWAGSRDATWYYPTGQVMMNSAGEGLLSEEELLYPCNYIQ